MGAVLSAAIAWLLAVTVALVLCALLAFIYDGRNAFRPLRDRRHSGSA